MIFMIKYNYVTILCVHQPELALQVSDGVQEVRCCQYYDQLQQLHMGASRWVLLSLLIEA